MESPCAALGSGSRTVFTTKTRTTSGETQGNRKRPGDRHSSGSSEPVGKALRERGGRAIGRCSSGAPGRPLHLIHGGASPYFRPAGLAGFCSDTPATKGVPLVTHSKHHPAP